MLEKCGFDIGSICELKICVFPGTFNPFTDGHLSVLEQAMKEHNFDKVFVCPAQLRRNKQDVADISHRVNMIELATLGKNNTEILVIPSKGDNLVEEVLKFLKRFSHAGEVYYLQGSDAFLSLNKQCSELGVEDLYKEVLKIVKPIVVIRKGVGDNDTFEKECENFENKFRAKPRVLEEKLHGCSSTLVRSKLSAGCEKTFLHEDVFAYIKDNRLYGSDSL